MSSPSPINFDNRTLAIVGVGLIGGSVGLAARRTGRFSRILGVGRDETSLERARRFHCVDETLTELEFASNADVVVLCSPVDQIVSQALVIAARCRTGTLLTDAGSTKAMIVAEIEAALPPHIDFVGAHPLAGSEKRGPENSRADLFDERITVLTPTEKTRPEALQRASEFWQSLGCQIRVMPADEHDRALALTSHLPHLLAAALCTSLPAELHELTATGFRDTTRIASGDPVLWAAILRQNTPAVLAALEKFDDRLAAFRAAMASADTTTMLNLLTEAKRTRDALGNRDPAS